MLILIVESVHMNSCTHQCLAETLLLWRKPDELCLNFLFETNRDLSAA